MWKSLIKPKLHIFIWSLVRKLVFLLQILTLFFIADQWQVCRKPPSQWLRRRWRKWWSWMTKSSPSSTNALQNFRACPPGSRSTRILTPSLALRVPSEKIIKLLMMAELTGHTQPACILTHFPSFPGWLQPWCSISAQCVRPGTSSRPETLWRCWRPERTSDTSTRSRDWTWHSWRARGWRLRRVSVRMTGCCVFIMLFVVKNPCRKQTIVV